MTSRTLETLIIAVIVTLMAVLVYRELIGLLSGVLADGAKGVTL